MIHVLDNVAESLMVLAKKHKVASIKYKTVDVEVELVMASQFMPEFDESPFTDDRNSVPSSTTEKEIYEKNRAKYEAELLGDMS